MRRDVLNRRPEPKISLLNYRKRRKDAAGKRQRPYTGCLKPRILEISDRNRCGSHTGSNGRESVSASSLPDVWLAPRTTESSNVYRQEGSVSPHH